ncbi:MAG TPA: hypothetical protein VMV31_03370 [Terriglobales bacterium]|nr:hypothetical protein [Terriglobales bacterium]
MSKHLSIVGLVGMALAFGQGSVARGQAPPPGGTVVDGIAAVVDGAPLLRSEVENAAWYARLSAQLARQAAPAGAHLEAAEKQTALRHLIDEQLLAEAQADEGYPPPPPAQLETDVETQWAHLAGLAGGEAALDARLAADHLDRAAVTALLRRQLTLLAFLDQHFSGSGTVTAAQIQHYYETTFVPEAERRHLAAAPLAQVRATIATLLRQRQRAAEEQQWLQTLRAGAHIELRRPW